MRNYTEQQVVDAATTVMDNTRQKLAEGKVSLDEKQGAIAASVAIMMLLGIQVVFVDKLKPGVN